MAWDEWEQLKSDAMERSSAQTQLNQLSAGQGGSTSGGTASGDVKSDKKAWSTAGTGLKLLDEPIGRALTQLSDGQTGLEAVGVQSAVAQKELYDSWKKYVKGVSRRCGDLGGLLDTAGHTLSKTDEQLKGELDKIKNQYQDTAAVGGAKTEK
ncbi:hypothetical protein [Streptomyces sp. NP-1717]|uniref:hypothetical protein n=1 Tax=unclassified Streptomyces TaxID=2593676 RepID=UPI001F5C5CA9|nr:hypothetical protein [Streptomyces sp. NP-1717]MCI3223354.1 hypothetical protein [Streptomyces sp. NP-1717]WTA75218.1 hypothetical protein OG705_21290 [Streptomyces sp. NBC_00838]